jgi:Protein of unknown function (DUF3048) N-terminal domain/Protein of unknown function (DUF3048) C-terminal domain
VSRRLPTALLGIAIAVAGVACSGSDEAADTTAVPATVATTSTSVRATTTTSVAGTTTTAEAGPTMPLTGLPVEDQAAADRPALVVKIDNHPRAIPQAGLQVADLVYEENVESLTRFAAVFHSEGSDPVGPIRSGRTQDVQLLGSLTRPLFVWSGGNPNVTRAVQESDLVNLSGADGRVAAAGGFFRSDRPGPHDYYASTTKLWALAPPDAVPPPPQFTYRDAGVGPSGDPGDTARVRMDNVDVLWVWDDARSQYLRQQNGQPHLDDTGTALGTENVVVLTVDYQPSAADRRSPEAQTIGTGEAVVLTGGVAIRGTWERLDRAAPFTLRDEGGAVIALTPGSAWVELARVGATTVPA